jgi:murein DD-endopeptidase MepM/ murein hydrolase activator NlpD
MVETLMEESVMSEEAAEMAPTSATSRPPAKPDRTRAIGLGAIGAFVAVGLGLIVLSPRRAPVETPPPLALTNADLAADAGSAKASATSQETHEVADAASPAPAPRPPPAWRAASLKVDASVDVVEGTFGKKGLVQSLTQAGLARPEIKRLARAFDNVRRFERPLPTDAFVLVKDKAKATVVAFELATSPTDVWQTRLDDGSELRPAKRVELFVERKRVASSLVVSSDLAKSIAAAGLRPEIVDAVDDALEGHVEASALRGGARMRVAATEDWVEGTFARIHVDAVEFVPAGGAAPLRIYYYERDASVEGSHRHAPAAGFYDTKGKQPYKGAFRSPLPLARVTSRFNPKRMHPVLHVVMPHNGVDYGATTGTPAYASADGTVVTAGNGGPCGNMVEIAHAGGITTVYCHLKGFAQGLHSGQKVEARQLIGYVGQTGRVTGPHLHFGVKKNGVFVDPLGLKMDGVRVLPPADRDAFARKRADLDGVLEGVAMPSLADAPQEAPETDEPAEDGDVHPD